MTVGLLLLLCILALIGWLGYSLFRKRQVGFHHLQVLTEAQQEAATRVTGRMLPLMQESGYRLATQSPLVTSFICSYRPAWLAIPCVLLFPIGLLSLFYKQTVEVTFAFMPAGEATEVSVSGNATRGLLDRIIEELATLNQADANDLRANAGAC